MLIFKKDNPENQNLDKYFLFAFSLLIIIEGLFDTLSNKTYINDSWTIGEELKSYKAIQNNKFRYNLIEKCFFKFEIHKRSKILLTIFAYPHCFWGLYYLQSLIIFPSYSILKKLQIFLR